MRDLARYTAIVGLILFSTYVILTIADRAVRAQDITCQEGC